MRKEESYYKQLIIMSDKIYTKHVYYKEIETQHGTLINADFKLEEFYNWGKQFVNEKGYLKTTIFKSKEIGKYGDSHYSIINTYKPKPQGNNDIQVDMDDVGMPF